MQNSGLGKSCNAIGSLVAGLLLSLMSQLPCSAIDAQLVDPILPKQFQWAMFVEMNENMQYLNYPGSKLNPLTRLRVTANTYPRATNSAPSINPAQLYEDFWYHEDQPIGLRRFGALNIERNQIGAIFLGTAGDNSAAAGRVLVRLAVELDLQGLSPSVIEVPLDKYDAIVSELAHYSFAPKICAMAGRQFSIHLRSYPYKTNKDAYYYLQH
ncbi:MAG TPA: hypothetical protein V6C97_12135 [Oculatellaceae cyanobacterium]